MWKRWRWTGSSEGHRAWKGERLRGKCPLFLSNLLAAARESTCPELPSSQRWKKASPSFSRQPLPPAVWSALAVGDAQSRWCARGGARPGHFRSIPPAGVAQNFDFPRDNGGWRLEPRGAKLERRTIRSVSTQPLLGMSYAEYLILFRRAAANLQINEVPIKAATLELRWTEPRRRERWNPCKNADDGSRPSQYDATKRGDVSTRPELVQAHFELCKNLLPFVLLHGHASPTLHRLLRLQCLTFSPKQRPADVNTRLDFVHADEWRNSRRDALATSIVSLDCQQSLAPAERNATFGGCQGCLSLPGTESPEMSCVPPHVCEWQGHASISQYLSVWPTLSDRTSGNSMDYRI